jgi:hypothetical protein
MFRTKNPKQANVNLEEDFATYEQKKATEFHPHCFMQQLALAEAKQYDEIYALAHAPVHGDEEEA